MQHALHHRLHLRLGGSTIADDRLLQLHRGVFVHRKIRGDERRDGRPARLSEQQRRLRIGVEEHDLDGSLLRTELRDHFADAVEDGAQSRGQGAGGDPDHAAADIAEARPVGVDHAEAGHAQARVDAEDPHA